MSYSNPFISQDKVKHPCVDCKNSSNVEYNFLEVTDINSIKEKDYVLEVDFSTFLSINNTEKNEVARVYSCSSCGHKIIYLPDSGCKYIT